MKFSNAALLVAAFSGIGVHAIDSTPQGLRPGASGPTEDEPTDHHRDLTSSSKSAPSQCDNCGAQLPGYVLWGSDYLEKDFYEGLPERVGDGEASDPLIFGPINTCYDSVPNAIFCMVLTLISELIYKSDTLSCVLTGVSKTARDTVCFLLDLIGVPNPDIVGSGGPLRKLLEENPSLADLQERRKLGGDSSDMDGFMAVVGSMAKGGGDIITKLFGILIYKVIAEAKRIVLGPDYYDRELEFDNTIRSGSDEVSDGLTEFGDAIDELFGSDGAFDVIQGLLGTGFFAKCLSVVGGSVEDPDLEALFICPIIFTYQKTQDAIICKYQEDCKIADACTADQQFKTEYHSRRLAQQIPDFLTDDPPFGDGPTNFLLADILAPCLPCEDHCAPFCWYHDNFDSCDAYKRGFLADGGEDLDGQPLAAVAELTFGLLDELL